MKLSVVILHTNDKLIFQTLDSLFKTVKTEFECILVDNNKNKLQFEEIKKQYPQIKTIQNPKNYGYARGINVGLKAASGDFILALNPDIILFEKTIDIMVEYMEKNKDVAVLGPKLVNADKSLQYSCRRFPKLSTMLFRRGPFKRFVKKALEEYEMHDSDHNKIQEVDWMCGGFLLIRKDVFQKIGFMDEFYFLYFDDVDFCRRAHHAGKVVYFPESQAIHAASYESKTKLIPFLIHLRSMIYYFLKYALNNHNP
jgi:GT2 family glycosyltransferase